MVVLVGAVRHQEAGEGAELLPDLVQVADDLGGFLFAAQHPVLDEGVVGHQRGHEHRAQQVALDLRVDVVAGQRQFVLDDRLAQAVPRRPVADGVGGQEARHQDDADDGDQLGPYR